MMDVGCLTMFKTKFFKWIGSVPKFNIAEISLIVTGFLLLLLLPRLDFFINNILQNSYGIKNESTKFFDNIIINIIYFGWILFPIAASIKYIFRIFKIIKNI